MTTENPGQKTEPTPAADTSNQAEVDQLKAQLAAQAAEMDSIANAVLANIPEGLKALIPDELSPAAKVNWFNKAQAAGLLNRPQVPGTDDKKPGVLPVKVDPSTLPPIARISHGYGSAK